MTVTCIIGANRGIGLELARVFLSRGNEVYGTTRSPSEALSGLTGINVVEGVDISKDECVEVLSGAMANKQIDNLIINAGVLSSENLDNMDFAAVAHQYNVNSIGPMRCIKALLNNLVEGSKIYLMTSRMGSVGDRSSGGWYGYSMSKAAVNMFAKSLSNDLKPKGIAVGLVHPGFVRTDMTEDKFSSNVEAMITPRESVEGLMKQVDRLTLDTTGSFWSYDGSLIEW